jgi:hypothetical protein
LTLRVTYFPRTTIDPRTAAWISIEIPAAVTKWPGVVVHFLDADRLSGEDLAEIDFLSANTDAPTTRDPDVFIG